MHRLLCWFRPVDFQTYTQFCSCEVDYHTLQSTRVLCFLKFTKCFFFFLFSSCFPFLKDPGARAVLCANIHKVSEVGRKSLRDHVAMHQAIMFPLSDTTEGATSLRQLNTYGINST